MGKYIKFREFLKCRRTCARLQNRLFTWAWLKDCWRPVKSYRTVKRGRRKGWIEITLYYPEGKKAKVPASHMRYKEVDYAEQSYAG